MILLMDPLLLEPPGVPGEPLPSDSDFWLRVVQWAADHRVKLGAECHELVCAQYAEYGYPTENLSFASQALRKDYQAALGRLLSRVLPHCSEPGERTFTPGYQGSDEQALALQYDIAGTEGLSVLGLATAEENWSARSDTVTFDPVPPEAVALCVVPGQELPQEQKDRIREFFTEKNIHIVGGRPDASVLDRLSEMLGIDEDRIRWLPCERARPPRELQKRWSGLRPPRDITVCITGRVGHATSQKAQVAAERADVAHLKIESPSDLVRALRGHAMARDNRS